MDPDNAPPTVGQTSCLTRTHCNNINFSPLQQPHADQHAHQHHATRAQPVCSLQQIMPFTSVAGNVGTLTWWLSSTIHHHTGAHHQSLDWLWPQVEGSAAGFPAKRTQELNKMGNIGGPAMQKCGALGPHVGLTGISWW